MSWFKSIKKKSHSKNGNLLSIRISQKPDGEGGKAYFIGDQWVGGEWDDGAAIIVPCAVAEAVISYLPDDEGINALVYDAMIAFLVGTQDSCFHQLFSMSNDWNTETGGQINGDIVIEIPHSQLQYYVSSSKQEKVEYRNVFFLPVGAYAAEEGSGKDMRFITKTDGFGGFHIPDTSIVAVRVHGVQGWSTIGSTLCHEYIHASWDVGDVSKVMYGATEADQREECITHFVTDNLDSLLYVRDKLPNQFSHKFSTLKQGSVLEFINKPKNKSEANWGLPILFVRGKNYEGENIITLAEENNKFAYKNMLCVESAGDHPELGHQDTQIQFNKRKFTRTNSSHEASDTINNLQDLFKSKSVTNECRTIFNNFKAEMKRELSIARNNLGRNAVNVAEAMDAQKFKVRQRLLKNLKDNQYFNYNKYEGIVNSRKQSR